MAEGREQAVAIEYVRSSPTVGSKLGGSLPDATTEVKERKAAWAAYWESLPARYKLCVAGALAFVIGNMDKVNMSVAIIPMAEDFGWSPSTAGLIQSAFFWGYLLAQLPGGSLTAKLGGRRIMPGGVALWSVSTAAVPLLAATIPTLCLSRAAVGLGEAVAPTAATDMVAKTVPPEERARAVSFVFSGLHVGSILGLIAAPYLLTSFGWESVFVTFGVAGLAWVLWFEQLMGSISESDPDVLKALTQAQVGTSAITTVPWRAFIRERPVQALMFTHFCNNWFHYTMLAWLPTYFTDTLSVDIMHAAQTALLPPLAGMAATAIAGPSADALISRGVPVSAVRKLAQGIAFLVPSMCLIGASQYQDSHNLNVALITAALGISSFSLAGLYCTHQDLSPKYASALLGLTNTSGAVPGIIGVAFTGFLYDQTGSWPLALFFPTIFFLLSGTLVYTVLGRNEAVDFDKPHANDPFGFEQHIEQWKEGLVVRGGHVRDLCVSYMKHKGLLHAPHPMQTGWKWLRTTRDRVRHRLHQLGVKAGLHDPDMADGSQYMDERTHEDLLEEPAQGPSYGKDLAKQVIDRTKG